MPNQYFYVRFVSNVREKVLILVESRGHIYHVVSHLASISIFDWTTTKDWHVVLAFFQPPWYVYMLILENCQNNILMNSCFPIQGTRFSFLLFNEARISECNLRSFTLFKFIRIYPRVIDALFREFLKHHSA